MARYFISTEYDSGNSYRDEEGSEFADLPSACDEARQSMRELVIDAWRCGIEARIPARMIVSDESGREVGSVLLKQIIPAALLAT
jgi:hypothetical protein